MTIIQANILDWAAAYDGPLFHACLCDAPYEMEFMGKGWDNTGVAFNPETWKLIARCLHPGALLFVFAGTINDDLISVAMRQAGLRKYHKAAAWSYGCLSDDTEILTSNGWERYHKAIAQSNVMCYNPDTEALEWHRVQELVTYDYDETAYRIHSERTDQIVSRNHRCLVERGGRWVFEYAERLAAQEVVPILENVPELRRVIHSDECQRVSTEILFAGMRPSATVRGATPATAIQTQGSAAIAAQGQRDCLSGVRQASMETGSVATQGKDASMLASLQWCSTIAASGQIFSQRQRQEELQKGQPRRPQPGMERRRNLLQETRQLQRREVYPLPGRISQHGPQGRLCDGASANGRTGDRSAATALGSGTSQRSQPGTQRAGQFSAVRKQPRSQALRASRIATPDLATVTPVHYRGVVWCVRVPTGAFVARRNGKIFITGNSGFPKAARLDTVIDRRAGVERTKVGTKKHQPKFDAKGFDYRKKDNGYNSKERATFDITAPATELAATWQGHRYGGQVLKPALESILIFQKPYDGSPVDCITATGAGALNIEASRITWDAESLANDTKRRQSPGTDIRGGRYIGGENGGYDKLPDSPAGRWPANLMLSHSPDCNGDCAPECAVRRLGEQSGETTAGHRPGGGTGGIWSDEVNICISPEHGDTGTAARFFFNADYMAERLEDSDPVLYEAKSSRSEREAGLDPRQVRLMEMDEAGNDEQRNRVYAGGQGLKGRSFRDGQWVNVEHFAESTINDGRAKSIDNPYQRGETTRRNTHPTIKPISLARHLATLLLPPTLYAPRRLLIPFAGAGSEMIGALLAGWEDIVGVELEEDHCRIAAARLAYWQQRKHEFLDPSKPITAALSDAPDGQLDLFGDDL